MNRTFNNRTIDNRTIDNQTLFRLVCQTGRPVFRHSLYITTSDEIETCHQSLLRNLKWDVHYSNPVFFSKCVWNRNWQNLRFHKFTVHTYFMFMNKFAGNLKPEALECDECDYRCDLQTQLNCHKQIVHKDGEIPFACNLCPQQVS